MVACLQDTLCNKMQIRNPDANKNQRTLNHFYGAITQIRNSGTCEHTNMSKVMENKEVCGRICIEAKCFRLQNS